jgi:arylformamidase
MDTCCSSDIRVDERPHVDHHMTARRLIDVSHTVEHGMVTYKNFPAPIICDWLSREASRATYAPGTEFQIGKIEMIANTGTYADSPFHRYENGKDLSELSLESIADLDCVVVRVHPSQHRAIDQIHLSADRVRGRAVLFQTGSGARMRTSVCATSHRRAAASSRCRSR